MGIQVSTSKEQPNHNAAASAAAEQQFSSMVDASTLRGRGKDVSDLMHLLDCHDVMVGDLNVEENIEKVKATSRVAGGSTVRVNSITGLTGIGKTTVVQFLLRNQNVRKHFDNHIYWVSVSGQIDDKKRLASLIIEATQKPVPQYFDWNPLRIHLKDCIKDKKFLLILDDVCGVDKATWHEEMKPCLDAGAPGSRILVTTQDRNVAAKMGSSSEDILHLQPLSPEDSWLVLRDIALQSKTQEQIKDFECVGRELAKECQGIPFIIKTLGYFLREKRTSQEWLNVLESWNCRMNSVEEELLMVPPMLISCDASTANLREFFKFCACLPNDYEIDKDYLIRLWMAQGFLHRKQADQMEMERRGEEYFNTLVMLSFLQGYERGGVDDQKVIRYKFYRPLHALAQFQAGYESCCIENGTSSSSAKLKCSEKVHHLTLIFGDDNVNSISPTLQHMKKIQMLKFIKSSRRWNPLIIPPDVFRQYRHLRALDMSNTGLRDLSPDIDKLHRLRYLNLSGSQFTELPDTVCNLEHLETLILNDCKELARLPQKIGSLSKLRHLDLDNTPKLQYFPEGLGRLTGLRTLSKFVIDVPSSSRKGARIGELKELNLLQGHLEIRGLNRVRSGSEALKAELVKKKHLQSLCLNFELDPVRKPESMKIMENVLKALRPFPGMRNNVEVCNYCSSKYPSWVNESTRFTSN